MRRGPGSIPGQGTRSCLPQLKIPMLQWRSCLLQLRPGTAKHIDKNKSCIKSETLPLKYMGSVRSYSSLTKVGEQLWATGPGDQACQVPGLKAAVASRGQLVGPSTFSLEVGKVTGLVTDCQFSEGTALGRHQALGPTRPPGGVNASLYWAKQKSLGVGSMMFRTAALRGNHKTAGDDIWAVITQAWPTWTKGRVWTKGPFQLLLNAPILRIITARAKTAF